QIPIVEDTTIICYTDGLTDLVNENEQVFSLPSLVEFSQKNYTEDVQQINRKLLKEIVQFKAGRGFVDDITVLTVKIFGR
ncbi:MAG: SpoIIE family protein phosphatase, partial [Chitinophagales bacterium]|nr:SpoIIE family protein phosphatase [Chitinophagales bacterium]